MSAGVNVHTCPDSPGAHTASRSVTAAGSREFNTLNTPPHGTPIRPSSGTKSSTVVPASQLPVSVIPYAFIARAEPAQVAMSLHSAPESGAEPVSYTHLTLPTSDPA